MTEKMSRDTLTRLLPEPACTSPCGEESTPGSSSSTSPSDTYPTELKEEFDQLGHLFKNLLWLPTCCKTFFGYELVVTIDLLPLVQF